MKCKDVKILIPDLLSREITPDEQGIVIRHLKTCADCGSEMESLKLIFSAMTDLQGVAVPAGYWNNLLPLIHGRIEQREKRLRVPEGLLRYLLPSAAAATFIMFLVHYGSIGFQTGASDIHSIISQLPTEEIQQLRQADAADVLTEPSTPSNNEPGLASADKDFIKDILREEHSELSSEVDLAVTFTGMTDRDAEEIATILEQLPPAN